jgi:hypothetical protein
MRRFVSLLNYGILFKIISNLMAVCMLNLCWSHGQNNVYVGVQVVHTFAKCHIKIKLEKLHTTHLKIYYQICIMYPQIVKKRSIPLKLVCPLAQNIKSVVLTRKPAHWCFFCFQNQKLLHGLRKGFMYVLT